MHCKTQTFFHIKKMVILSIILDIKKKSNNKTIFNNLICFRIHLFFNSLSLLFFFFINQAVITFQSQLSIANKRRECKKGERVLSENNNNNKFKIFNKSYSSHVIAFANFLNSMHDQYCRDFFPFWNLINIGYSPF